MEKYCNFSSLYWCTYDLTNMNIFSRMSRLGREGVAEIKIHPFFQNDQWTFENLRDCEYILYMYIYLLLLIAD